MRNRFNIESPRDPISKWVSHFIVDTKPNHHHIILNAITIHLWRSYAFTHCKIGFLPWPLPTPRPATPQLSTIVGVGARITWRCRACLAFCLSSHLPRTSACWVRSHPAWGPHPAWSLTARGCPAHCSVGMPAARGLDQQQATCGPWVTFHLTVETSSLMRSFPGFRPSPYNLLSPQIVRSL